jgi:hypothetical protein
LSAVVDAPTVTVPGPQIAALDGEDATGGSASTIMLILSVPVQPFASMPVTVYKVVLAGVAITVLPDNMFKPVAGPHEYVLAPVAFSVVENPWQISLSPLIEMAGNELTITVIVELAVHPFPSVPVTVYVVVLEGDAVTLPPVVALKPVAGLQL